MLERRGHTEAAVDLARLAGLEPVGLIGELVGDDGMCLRADAIADLARADGLAFITIDQLAQWRRAHDPAPTTAPQRVTALASAHLPTQYGQFTITGYRDNLTGAEHVLLIGEHGIDADDGGPAWVRVHSECLTGDALGSLRCDCGDQLAAAQQHVCRHGGAIILLRGHEGRATGLLNKIAAYRAQDGGLDTVDAQTHLGLPVDAREYGAAVAILADVGITNIRLLTNNPAKIEALRQGGLEVTMTPLETRARPEDERYLRTKRDRMGHVLALRDSPHEFSTQPLSHDGVTPAFSTQGDQS